MSSTRSQARGAAEPPVRSFRRSLRALEREIELSVAAETECCGVTVAQCHLLLELEHRGPSSIGELADALCLDQSTLSRTADSLVKAGLATRADDPANRRRQILELARAGRDKADLINRRCDARYESILGGAEGRDRESMARTVAFLAGALRKLRSEGSSCSKEE
jgi:DNA-binding MarR family transcriptional regulator